MFFKSLRVAVIKPITYNVALNFILKLTLEGFMHPSGISL